MNSSHMTNRFFESHSVHSVHSKLSILLIVVEADAISIDSVSYVSSDGGSVRIVWPSPPNPNGIISYYQIRYRLLPLTKDNFPFHMSILETNGTMPLDRLVPVSDILGHTKV